MTTKKRKSLNQVHIGRKAPKGYEELAGGIHLGKGIWALPIRKIKEIDQLTTKKRGDR
jgi:hypothetical protein